MQLTMARTPSLRPILAIVMVALLTLALVAAALYIGSQRRPLPAPFGPARNGAVVYDEDGDLFIANEVTADARALLAGPDTDTSPKFSNQGDRIAFIRGGEGGFQLMSIQPDGSGIASLGEFPGEVAGFSWSPTGESILVNFTEAGITGFRLAVVNADGSGYRELDLSVAADWASWRANGEQIVLRGQLEDGTAGAFIADADGTNVRQLQIDSNGPVDFEGLAWSPNGEHLSFMSGGELSGLTGWQINVADIGADGSVTALHPLRMDADADHEYYPSWSPDSRQLAFMREKDLRRQIGISDADGTGFRLVGPVTVTPNMLGVTWSPDGATLLITEVPDFEPLRESKRKMWTVDVATGEYDEVQTPVATWQRLAP